MEGPKAAMSRRCEAVATISRPSGSTSAQLLSPAFPVTTPWSHLPSSKSQTARTREGQDGTMRREMALGGEKGRSSARPNEGTKEEGYERWQWGKGKVP